MTVQNQVARALEIARRIGAERPGPAKSERQTERLSSAIEAAPLVALGPDSTDQTARSRALIDVDSAALGLELATARARRAGALTQGQYAEVMRLVGLARETVGT